MGAIFQKLWLHEWKNFGYNYRMFFYFSGKPTVYMTYYYMYILYELSIHPVLKYHLPAFSFGSNIGTKISICLCNIIMTEFCFDNLSWPFIQGPYHHILTRYWACVFSIKRFIHTSGYHFVVFIWENNEESNALPNILTRASRVMEPDELSTTQVYRPACS